MIKMAKFGEPEWLSLSLFINRTTEQSNILPPEREQRFG